MYYYKRLEDGATKAYFEEDTTDSEGYSCDIVHEGGSYEMRKLSQRDVIYDGGHRQKKNKKEKADKNNNSSIWNCFQSKTSVSSEDFHEVNYKSMNPVQKKERI